jgi:hypothetical protein
MEALRSTWFASYEVISRRSAIMIFVTARIQYNILDVYYSLPKGVCMQIQYKLVIMDTASVFGV